MKHVAFRGSLRTKIIVMMLAITLVPMILTEVFIYSFVVSSINKQYAENSQRYLKLLCYTIDENIGELDKILLSIFADSRIQSDLGKIGTQSDVSALRSQIETVLTSQTMSRRDIDGTYIIAGDQLISNIWFANKTVDLSEDWYQKTIARDGALNIIGLAKSLGYFSSENTYVIAVARAIKDISTHEILGVVRMDINFRELQKICQGSLTDNSFIRIVDADDTIVFSTVPGDISHQLETGAAAELAMGSQAGFSSQISGRRYFVTYTYSSFCGWNILQYTPESTVQQLPNSIGIYIALSSLAFCLISLLASFGFARVYGSRIIRMRDSIGRISQGRFQERIPLDGGDELSQLASGINSMAASLDDTLMRLSEVKVKQKEMELRLLINQVKPHFLFNSLNSIKMLAVINEQTDIASMTETLGKYYRLSICSGGKFIQLQDEMEHTELYLKIQKFRYKSKLEYSITVENRLKKYWVMKLMLQPLVENAIVHGLENSLNGGFIEITVCEREEDLQLIIEDNGIGFDVREGLLTAEKSNGIGLRNVDERLRLLFGNAYGTQVTSTKGIGTRIVIRHPILQENPEKPDKE